MKIVDPAGTIRDVTSLGNVDSKKDAGQKADGRAQQRSKALLVNGDGPDADAASDSVAANVKQAPIPFYYGIPVWGEKYVDYLCRYALTSMLAPNNLPSLTNNDISTLLLATTPEDEKRIRSSDVFAALTRIINVEFQYLPSDDALPTPSQHQAKYNLLAVGHSMAADRAVGKGCAIFLSPDAIYSDGMFTRLYALAQSGKQAVVGMGPRVNEETIVPELMRLGLLDGGQPLTLGSRKAVELLLRHMHEDARLLRWSSPLFAQVPYMCMWDVGGGDGVLLRCFTLHPYLIDYRVISGFRARPRDTSAVDASFLVDCLIPWNTLHQVTDSDEMMVLSLTHMEHRDYPRVINTDPMQSIAASSRRHDISMLHRAYFMNAIKMHTLGLDDRWAQLERDTLKIAYDALGQMSANGHLSSIQDIVDAKAQELATRQLEALKAGRLQEIAAARANELMAGNPDGVSGRLALQVLIKKIASRLGFRY